MSKISVVMPTYNAEKYLAEAIESVLDQSLKDFEFIVVDYGSTDKTLSIIKSFKDRRIKLIENEHDFIGSLNLGMTSASGKYIACMDANDLMHIDRLRIQYAIMEDEPSITVCSSWVSWLGENIPRGTISKSIVGLLKHPILYFLKDNMIFHHTVMMRTDFIRTNSLKYEYYKSAEDYKLWVDIAKLGGLFYVESQPLLYYRVSDTQVNTLHEDRQKKSSLQIKEEILNYLISLNKEGYSSCSEILQAMIQLEEKKLLSYDEIYCFFYMLFVKNKNILNIKGIIPITNNLKF